MASEDLLANAAHVGAYFLDALTTAFKDETGVISIRGRGLMLGVELSQPCGALVGLAAEAGLLISVTADRVIRMVPPLIMTTAQAQEVVDILKPLVTDFLHPTKN